MLTTARGWGIRSALLALLAGLVVGLNGTAGDGKAPGGVPITPQDYQKFVGEEIKILQEALSSEKQDKKTVNRAKAAAVMLAAAAQFTEKGPSDADRATLRDTALKIVADINDGKTADALKKAQGLASLKTDPNAKLTPLALLDAKYIDLDIVMRQYGPPRVGGLSIESDLLTTFPKKKLEAADYDRLQFIGLHSAILSELIKPHQPEKKAAGWAPMAEESRKIALDLADAAKKQNGGAVVALINKLNSACQKCHDVYRFVE